MDGYIEHNPPTKPAHLGKTPVEVIFLNKSKAINYADSFYWGYCSSCTIVAYRELEATGGFFVYWYGENIDMDSPVEVLTISNEMLVDYANRLDWATDNPCEITHYRYLHFVSDCENEAEMQIQNQLRDFSSIKNYGIF